MSNETLDDAGVLAKFGVRADQVLDLLTLIGDAVDNVPGVPRSGPKTAAKWLAQYGTLDDLVAHAGEIGGVVGDNLRDDARLAAAGPEAPDGEDRLRAAGRRRADLVLDDARRATAATSSTRASSSRAGCATWARPPTRRRCRGRDRARPPRATRGPPLRRRRTRRSRPAPASPADTHYETVLDEAALERWLAAIATRRAHRVRHRDDEPRSDDTREIVGDFARRSSRAAPCYIPLAHRYAGAPDQLDRDARARAARAVARRSARKPSSART